MSNHGETTTLPTSVPVPDWASTPDTVTINTKYGVLAVAAMGTDDIFVDGKLRYRGNEYKFNYGHTTETGHPKGYYYPLGGGGQTYGPIPEGANEYTRRNLFTPEAPKTYVGPLLEAVRDAVQYYVKHHQDHMLAGRRANLVQDINRRANEYNDKAKAASKAHDAYMASLEALQALHMESGVSESFLDDTIMLFEAVGLLSYDPETDSLEGE